MEVWPLIKWNSNFFQAVAMSVILDELYHLDSNKTPEKKAIWKLKKNATCCLQQILEAAPYKTTAI